MEKPISKGKQILLTSPIILLAAVVFLLLVIFVITSVTGSPKNDFYNNSEASDELSDKDWVSYVDQENAIEFKYPKNWVAQSQETENGNVVLIAPADVTDMDEKIKVFVLENGYFGIDGLPTTNVTINGIEGIMVDEGLYGFMRNGKYITFDSSDSVDSQTYFNTIVKSLRFN